MANQETTIHKPIRKNLAQRLGYSKDIAPYIFVSPFFILFCIFGLYPIGYSFFISFFDMRLAGSRGFVGLNNYTRLFTTDQFFVKAFFNTVILLVTGSLLQHLFAVPMAIMMNNPKLKGRDTYKALFFAPYITSAVATVIIFGMVFDINYGLLNWVLENIFGIDAVRWNTTNFGIKAAISIMLNWRFIGFNMVLYIAGLQGIPTELYEAAEVDGATGFQKHWYITVPLLIPIIFFGVTLSIIGGFQLFDEPFVLLGGYEQLGGPGQNGLTMAFYLMWLSFKSGFLGRGSAVAFVMFFIILVFTWITRRAANKLQGK